MDEEKRKADHYQTITRRVAMIVIVVSLTPLILVTGIILYRFNTFSHEMVHAHLEEMVLKHKHNIDFFLQEKLSDIRHLSRSFELEEFKDEAFLRKRLSILQDEYSSLFADLGLINQEGRQVAYAGPFRLERAYYGDAFWFREAINHKNYISDVFLGLREQPHFIVSTRLEEADGAFWILRATIDFQAFNELVENLQVGKTGSAFILNRQGEFQTRPPMDAKLSKEQYLGLFKKRQASVQEKMVLEDWQKLPGTAGWDYWAEEPADSVLSLEKTGYRDRKIIIVAAFLKNNEWLLIFQQESDDAYAKLSRTQKIAGAILLLGGLSIIMVAFVFSRQMKKRMERVATEKEIMNKQIVETGKLATIGELAAGIAHEINNPVAIMVEEAGWISDLLEEGIDNNDNLAEFERALQQIETQGIRCKEITHKLLSFARKTDSRVHALQLNGLVEEVVDLSSQKSRYANVEIHTLLDPNLPDIQASATEMQQVLMNIINNAIDAMEKKGGQLHIATEVADDNHIAVTIADNGPGIPESNLNRIFDPFFTTKQVGKGTGLGLSICYGIVQKMGGTIEAESAVDVGTKFRIVLPVDSGRQEKET